MHAWRGILVGIIVAAVLLLIVLFVRTYNYHEEIIRLNKEMIYLEDRTRTNANNWIHHLESRINRVAQSQDEYQWSTSKRIDYLSDRITKLETRVKELERTIKKEKGKKNSSSFEEEYVSPGY